MTTNEFLSHFGFDTRRDLQDMKALEDAGLLMVPAEDSAVRLS